MTTIRDFAELTERSIEVLPTNHFLQWYYKQHPEPALSEVLGLWNLFHKFLNPFVEIDTRFGSGLDLSLARSYRAFIKQYGNRFATTVDTIRREYQAFGDLPDYSEYANEHRKILKLIGTANRTYVATRIAFLQLLKLLRERGEELGAYLEKPVVTQVFPTGTPIASASKSLSPEHGVEASRRGFRDNVRWEGAPFFEVMHVPRATTSLSLLRADDGPIFDIDLYPDYKDPDLPDFPGIDDDSLDDGLRLPGGIEIDAERGQINIPVGDDWGIHVGGELAPPAMDAGLYKDVDWDQSVADFFSDLGDAISDAFDCY
ncbi:MAG: hypothetical protein WEF50_01520 [Myxococcota bacterium]